jgi:hypothetical protein
MAENKNQHFVPQYYLERFGYGTNKKLIRLAHLDSRRVVHTASIRGQCSADYFYGKDSPIDAALRQFESNEGAVLLRIDESHALPQRDSVESHSLYQMAALFSSRTPRAAASTGNMMDAVLNETFQKLLAAGKLPSPPPGVNPEAVRVSGKNSAKASMATQLAFTEFIHLLDLSLTILQAPPDTEFITSDHPAVLVNQALAGKYAPPHSATGFALRGLQIALPISPSTCLFFYDDDVYRIGPKNSKAVSISSSDVVLLNALQVLNGGEHIYFHSEKTESSVRKLILKFLSRRPNLRSVEKIKKEQGTYMISSKEEVPLPGRWSFCKVRPRKGVVLRLAPRQPEFSRRVREWETTCLKGNLRISLEQFLSDPEIRSLLRRNNRR